MRSLYCLRTKYCITLYIYITSFYFYKINKSNFMLNPNEVTNERLI